MLKKSGIFIATKNNFLLSKHISLGKNGEQLAVDFLKNKGHLLLHTNYRSGHKEIDIITLDKDILVFSEIKTRSSYAFGFPEMAVTTAKQLLLKAAAEAFLRENTQYHKIRFDVVSILIKGGQITEIVHFEDAFY